MPYVGQKPSNGRFIELDALTASATATYTLQYNSVNYTPESVHNLIVSINGVVQKPSSMSLSGSSLTVGATLSSSDTIDYVRVLGDVGSVVTPTDGSVTAAKIGTGAVTDAKLATSLDFQNITIKGGSTNAMTVDSNGYVVMPNRPYFSGTKTNQSVSGSTNTILIPDTMQNNNGSHYSTSTGKFTAPVSAVYTFSGAFVFAENQQSLGYLQHSNSGGGSILQYYTANQTDSSAAELTRYVFTATFYMTATDTVCLTIAQFGNTQNVSCFFTGAMIG